MQEANIKLSDRIRVAIRQPLNLKKYGFNRLTACLSKTYDRLMFWTDRILSRLLVPVCDVYLAACPTRTSVVDVMLCMYKYSGDTGQESIEKFVLEDTLVNYIGDQERIIIHYWDVDQPLFSFGLNFYMKVRLAKPKNLVISSYSANAFYQPMPWLLNRLKSPNIRSIALWFDTCGPGFANAIRPLIETMNVHGIMENPTLNFGNSESAVLLSQRSRSLFCGFDLEFKDLPRTIPVAFFGQTSDYRSTRKIYLDFLLEHGVPLYYSAYDKLQQCSHKKYYEILSRARIGINFAMSTDVYQLKARVFETMHAGALLLEERNEQTAFYFSEDIDYVAYSSKEELLEKIQYYLANEAARNKIALAGNLRAKRLFNGSQFWKMAFADNSELEAGRLIQLPV